MSARARRLLAAAGIAAASIVVGTCATVGFGLATGFDRAARQADLPDVIARFDRESRSSLDKRVSALPNLQSRSYRTEIKQVFLDHEDRPGQFTRQGVLHILHDTRGGYAIVAGHDLTTASREVVVERGLAGAWNVKLGDTVDVGRVGKLRVVGIAVSPDNVAYPLSRAPRVYVGDQEIHEAFRFGDEIEPNLALLWLNDPSRADVTLTQARAVSFGIGSLSFITRAGVQVLLSQAAGIIISLLIAFSVVALAAAGTMLAAGAHAEVQRRLSGIGVQRALGFGPGRIAALHAREAALVALPATAVGLVIGWAAVSGPAADLLAALNEQPPGASLLLVLALAGLGVVALVTAAATLPAWRAARRSPASILRGGDLARAPRRGGGASGGMLGVGARFALAARGRWAASVATIAICAGVVTLMLALASLLERLRDDPGTVGKHYQLTAKLDAFEVSSVKALPGVADAAPRYQAEVADSFRLGEPLRLIAYPGDHTRFEAPPLASGRRVRSAGEAEVGLGLADALGLRPGSPLAVQTQSGQELRFRVSGVVRALENEGRMAYVRADRLIAADPEVSPTIAIRVQPNADRAQIAARLTALGAPPQRVGGATTRNGQFLGILAAVLRGVGLAVGLVCLYALVQALAMTARERRGAVALLRSAGGDALTVALVFAGAALAVAVPAALLGVVLERVALGPLVAALAAGFAALPLAPTVGQVVLVVGGLAALASLATALVARRVMREPPIAGLREE